MEIEVHKWFKCGSFYDFFFARLRSNGEAIFFPFQTQNHDIGLLLIALCLLVAANTPLNLIKSFYIWTYDCSQSVYDVTEYIGSGYSNIHSHLTFPSSFFLEESFTFNFDWMTKIMMERGKCRNGRNRVLLWYKIPDLVRERLSKCNLFSIYAAYVNDSTQVT